ncbi:AAA family ATPase [Alienimonas sp. DA493]|uniref:AAA family ATPase n=1 Tax=Alienimonas sp. DA493 TaxID=3373605 RepID=UPI0037550517
MSLLADADATLAPAEFLARLRGGDPEPEPTVGAPEQEPPAASAAATALMHSVADGQSAAPARPATDFDDPRDALAGVDPEALAAAARAAAGDEPGAAQRLAALYDRVEALLGPPPSAEDGPGFRPPCPNAIEESGLTEDEVERLVLKYLLNVGAASGRAVCRQIKLPFTIVDPIVRKLRKVQYLTFNGAAEAGDYTYQITEAGREAAAKFARECTYFGAAPVPLEQYLAAMSAQSITGQVATEAGLREAFKDLLINEAMFERLGPAINSGRGMFLFGEPGNGKTSIAERITRAFGSSIWIPRAITVDGDILRLFDPGVHEEVSAGAGEGLLDLSGVDPRWVHVVRPTVIAGGELTMQELEVVQNPVTKICEAPLQLKSNCGTLVIDDFGRQTMPVDVLLNRWIVPLEKRYDFLNLPSGKKVQVPFDQLIVFSTNLEPRDLVDGAFLRRIPYKIEVPDPSREEFTALMKIMCGALKIEFDPEPIEYLIETHYVKANRPFRCCQPRDLLMQVRNYCAYKQRPVTLSNESFDFAVANYFSVM